MEFSNASSPLVSVVVPVYNASAFLEETLESLLNQNFTNFELICVNDKSTDNSLKILRDFQKRFDGRMRIINNQVNVGSGEARNIGLKEARGKYLAIFDADDVYFPKMLEKMVEVAEKNSCELVAVGSEFYKQKYSRVMPVKHTIRRDLLPEQEVFAISDVERDVFELFKGWTWDKLFLREFIVRNKLRFQDLRSSDDAYFTFMAIIQAKRIVVIDEVLVRHRILDSGSVSTSREESWGCFYLALVGMRERLKKWGVYDKLERDFINYALSFSLWHLVTMSGEAYYLCYEKLTEVWWRDLGIVGRSADFFYDQNEYDLYTVIQRSTASDFLFYYRKKLEETVENCSCRIEELVSLSKEKDLRLKHDEVKLKKLQDCFAQKERELMASIDALNRELSIVRSSHAFNIGRKITWLPHLIKTKLFRRS